MTIESIMQWLCIWLGDIIGIILTIFLALFFVDNMFPDPPPPPKKPNYPITPTWI